MREIAAVVIQLRNVQQSVLQRYGNILSNEVHHNHARQNLVAIAKEDILLSHAEVLIKNNEPLKCLEFVDRLLSKNCRKAEKAHTLKCKALFRMGDLKSAFNACQLAISLFPHHPDIIYWTGRAAVEYHQTDIALSLFSKAIIIKPDHVPSWIARGLTYHHQKSDIVRAVSDLNKAMQLNPSYFKTFFHMAMAMIDLNRLSLAIEAFTKCINLNASYSEAYFRRGVVYLKLQEFEQALQDFEKTISLCPDCAEAHYNCGLTHQLLKQQDLAILSYEKCLQQQPENLNALRNCARALIENGQFHESISKYSNALQLCYSEIPTRVDVLLSRGHVYEQLRCLPQALADYSRALLLEPKNPKARTVRGLLALQFNDFKLAINDLSISITLDPSNPKTWINRGLAYSRNQLWKQALNDFNQALSVDHTCSKAYRHKQKIEEILKSQNQEAAQEKFSGENFDSANSPSSSSNDHGSFSPSRSSCFINNIVNHQEQQGSGQMPTSKISTSPSFPPSPQPPSICRIAPKQDFQQIELIARSLEYSIIISSAIRRVHIYCTIASQVFALTAFELLLRQYVKK